MTVIPVQKRQSAITLLSLSIILCWFLSNPNLQGQLYKKPQHCQNNLERLILHKLPLKVSEGSFFSHLSVVISHFETL